MRKVGVYTEPYGSRRPPVGRQVRTDQRGTVNDRTPEQPADIVARLRATFRRPHSEPLAWRTTQLRRLRELLTTHGAELAEALHADLGKSSTEAFRTEIDFTVREIDHTLDHLDAWLRPSSPRSPPTSAATRRPGRGTTRWVSCWSSPPGTIRCSSC